MNCGTVIIEEYDRIPNKILGGMGAICFEF